MVRLAQRAAEQGRTVLLYCAHAQAHADGGVPGLAEPADGGRSGAAGVSTGRRASASGTCVDASGVGGLPF